MATYYILATWQPLFNQWLPSYTDAGYNGNRYFQWLHIIFYWLLWLHSYTNSGYNGNQYFQWLHIIFYWLLCLHTIFLLATLATYCLQLATLAFTNGLLVTLVVK